MSVPTVTAVNVIAASHAEDELAWSSIVAPIDGIRAVRRERRTIARVKGGIGDGARKRGGYPQGRRRQVKKE